MLGKIGSQGGTTIASEVDNAGTDSEYDVYWPLALSVDGAVLFYEDEYSTDLTFQEKLLDYRTGTQAPQLASGSNPTSLASASVSDNGLEVVYTLYDLDITSEDPVDFFRDQYPGVYLWTP